jgi:hypothetical protein
VVHREDSAPGLDVPLPLSAWLTEVDEADDSERVRVPAVGRDLLPWNEADAVLLAHGWQVCVVTGGVVVRHRERVEAAADRQGRQLLDAERAVRVDGVCVEVGGQPPHPVDVRHGAARRALRHRRDRRLRIALRRDLTRSGRPNVQPVVDAGRRDAVQADQHPPMTRSHGHGEIAGGRPLLADDEVVSRATGQPT